MVVNISTDLKVGKLLGEKNEWKMKLGYEGNMKEHSFFISFDENSNLDANVLISDLLGIDNVKIAACFEVSEAGVLYADESHLIQETGGWVPDINEKTQKTLCELVRYNSDIKYEKSICMWLSSKLNEIDVFNGLIKFGYNDVDLIMLLCLIKNDKDFFEKYFYAKLPDIKIFSIINLSNVYFKYAILSEDNKRLCLNGKFGIEIANKLYKFSGNVAISNEGYSAVLNNDSELDVLSMFGGRAGDLSFKELQLGLKCQYKNEKGQEQKEYYIVGKINIIQVETSGCIYFNDNNIALAQIEIGTQLSIATLCNSFFGEGFWNENIFDIKFMEGTTLNYCSVKEGYVCNNIFYEQGLSLRLLSKIKIFNELQIEGKICINDLEVVASLVTHDSIDFGFFTIEGVKNGDNKELLLSFIYDKNKSQKCIMIKGNLFLFGYQFIAGEIIYYPDEVDWKIVANLSSPQSLPMKFCDTFKITYSNKNRFSLQGNAFHFESDKLDFLKNFNAFLENKKGLCSKISISHDSKIVNLKFNILPKFLCKDETIHLIFVGKLILLKKDNSELETFEFMTEDSLTLDADFNFEKLDAVLPDILNNVINSFIKDIFQENNVKKLENITLYIVKQNLEEYLQQLICRKILNVDNAKNISKYSGGGCGLKPCTFAEAGGTAFNSKVFQEALTVCLGMFGIIFVFKGGGTIAKADRKLEIPEFEGVINESGLQISIKQDITDKENVVTYKIFITWEKYKDKNSETIEYKVGENTSQISLIDIPVYGKTYVAVRAIHRNEELSSNWSEANLLADITIDNLIDWIYNSNYCIRDCYKILDLHAVNINDESVIKKVIKKYAIIETSKEIAYRHFTLHDSAEVCLLDICTQYPHISYKEMINSMWYEGYNKNDICIAIECKEIDVDKLLSEIIVDGGVNMTCLKTELENVLCKKEEAKINEQEFLSQMVFMYEKFGGLELAIELKAVGISADNIASFLSRINVEYIAVTTGGILLNKDVYPNIGKDEMKNILSNVFPDENIEQALEVLYPTHICVDAKEFWCDTGIKISSNELVSIRYESGTWRVVPGESFYGAEGSNRRAKEGYVLPDEKEGCLVGKVGDEEPFLVGVSKNISGKQGKLFLCTNDDAYSRYGAGFSDNEGAITVVVSKEIVS